MAYTVVFTDVQFCTFLIDIAQNYPTGYNNTPYFNCGYYTGTEWTFDCWNLIKSVIWGWNGDTTVGSYTYSPGLYGLGDWNGIQLLSHCTYVAYDFTSIGAGEYMYLSDTIDHAGIYVGTQIVNGEEYNVVEATPIWNNGVQLSYVDASGVRYNHKNGTPAGVWTAHGRLPWIDYSGQPIPPYPPYHWRRRLPVWMLLKYHF